MNRYPLFFTHGRFVAGQGFMARVEMNGRCILEQTADDFWSVFGLNPGAAAGQGDCKDVAFRDFLDNVQFVVKAFAEDAASFEEFDALVTEFFTATNPTSESEWHDAVRRVRAGELSREDFERQADAEVPPRLSIAQVAGPNVAANDSYAYSPDLNFASEDEMAAAA